MESTDSFDDQRQFALIEPKVKSESVANSPLHAITSSSASPKWKSSSPNPLPSTETPDHAPLSSDMAATQQATKKKGTASAVKKTPKRKIGGETKKMKKPKSGLSAPAMGDTSADEEMDQDGEAESDNGPYCLCRGPDDHRWMICCERCEDWFHGECINMDKTIGESLIEKFICPLCSHGGRLKTIYKKTCALGGCKKAARLTQDPSSVFCSNEHAQTWWERMIARLPKAKARVGLSDQLSQEELMALLSSSLAGVDESGTWTLTTTPFADAPSNDKIMTNGTDEHSSETFSEEEKTFLDNAVKARLQLADETILCHKMTMLTEMAQDRRRAAITSGRFGEDICGYDQRLDTISARDAFAAYAQSSEGEAALSAGKLDDPEGKGDEVRGMCERKRCKVHAGWQKMLILGIKYQIREMATEAEELGEEERIVKQAAAERQKRRRAEKNWVEVIEG